MAKKKKYVRVGWMDTTVNFLVKCSREDYFPAKFFEVRIVMF